MHTVSTSIVDNHIRFEVIKTPLHSSTDLVGKLLVSCKNCNSNCVLYKLGCKVIARIYLLVIGVDYVVLQRVLVITLVSIALMSVQINNHKPLHIVPLLHVPCYESNVWVDAEASTRVAGCVVEATAKINCPSFLPSKTRSINTALTCTRHRVKQAHPEHPPR